ncbi:Gx transporter family protein [Butyricicoccus sp.]|uniref:Gx transporter family protein n=1 Tax=Butyricicoccus sp. TaxID=2049021 RepID=UPI003F13F08C
MSRTKRIALCGMLSALALALSLMERMIPLELLIPIPGIKLGLANVVTMFALLFLSPKEAYSILLCRVVLASLFAGSVTQFLFSLMGGLLALTTTWLLLHWHDRWFSFYGISAASAAMHNFGQILAAMLVMQTVDVIAYLPLLLVSSIPMGFVTGTILEVLQKHMRHLRLISRDNAM